MKRICLMVLILLFIPAVMSCRHFSPMGFIYTHITQPLDPNCYQTPVATKHEDGDIKHISYYVDVKWNSNAIGDIVKKSNFQEVYFADMETLRVLGIWSQYTVHIYGK